MVCCRILVLLSFLVHNILILMVSGLEQQLMLPHACLLPNVKVGLSQLLKNVLVTTMILGIFEGNNQRMYWNLAWEMHRPMGPSRYAPRVLR